MFNRLQMVQLEFLLHSGCLNSIFPFSVFHSLAGVIAIGLQYESEIFGKISEQN